MNQSQIQQTLAKLHDELNNTQEVDDETRTLLTSLAADIQRLSEQGSGQSADEVESLTGQVQEVLLKFEADHPRMTTILNQISVALANLGI